MTSDKERILEVARRTEVIVLYVFFSVKEVYE